MATFTNFATLSYNGGTTNSNIVTGEILGAVTVSKTAVADNYTVGDDLTYVITLVNSGSAAANGLTVTDDLGAYEFATNPVYPLAFREGTLRYFVNGVLSATPQITDTQPLTVSGINIPAGGNAVLVYEANLTQFAPLAEGSTVTNTVNVTGGGLIDPVSASETVTAVSEARLNIRKSLSPAVVTESGQLTYTFVIENTGNAAAPATENIVLTDNFDPILNDIIVTLDGQLLTEGVDYTYNETTGEFATVQGRITVPAATFTQNPDGSISLTPGSTTLVITGTV